jgi:hypothetical protein
MTVSDEQERMSREAVMVCFKAMPSLFAEESHEEN